MFVAFVANLFNIFIIDVLAGNDFSQTFGKYVAL